MKKKTDSYEISDCPFCGSSDVDVDEDGSDRAMVVCDECGVIGPVACNEYNAVRLWNLRP